jgi:hypothetical protein
MPQVHDFALLLRELKQRAGRSYEALARRAGVSSSAVHRYCAGQTVPAEFGVVERLGQACGASRAEMMELHRRWAVAAAVRDRSPADHPQPTSAPVDGRTTAAAAAADGGAVAGPPTAHAGAPAPGETLRRNPPAAASPPAQLPLDVHGFAGRDGELAQLDAVLAAAAGQPRAVVISAVSGTAGVGKTALAVHWAHRVAGRFADGQLYVNLRGFDPGGQAMAPADAIRGFLDALGVPAERIPPGLDAQAALYRSTMAGRRVLVVLDNARDAEQARPLLPGTSAALVVATSRRQLTPLVAADGAHPITVDTLSTVEARELLAHRLGADRLAAEPAAAEDIIAACARLPLALTIVAARAATHPTFPLTTLADELTESRSRLEALTAGDPATDVRAVFSWSYHALTPPAARLFRLLGLHPGPDTSVQAAASLAGQPVSEVLPLVAELARATLITEHAPARYTFHDLLRAYADDLTRTHDSDEHRRAAIGRLLDHYLHTAHAADRLLHPHRDPIPLPLPAPAPGASPEHPADHDHAMAWLVAEYPGLLAGLRLAFDTGHDSHTWYLAWALDTFLERRGHWHTLVDTWETALDAAGRLGQPVAQGHAHRLLGCAHTLLGRYADAHTHLRRSLDLHAQTGDLVGQAHTYNHLALLDGLQGRPRQALDQVQPALAIYQAARDLRGQAYALNSVGWYRALLGDHTEALTVCEQALMLFQELGDRPGEANTWDSLGYAHHRLDHHTAAVDCYQHAFDLYRDLGDRYNQADTLTHLGDTHHTAGNPAAARTAWQHALVILTDLDHPDAADLRGKLDTADREACAYAP